MNDVGASHLADALGNGSRLKELGLWENSIGSQGVKVLTSGLRDNTYLRMLRLSYNQFGDDGVGHLAQYIKEHFSLKMLDIDDVGMTEIGYDALMDGLCTNSHINQIDMQDNLIENPEIVVPAMVKMFRKNGTLTEFYWIYEDEILDIITDGLDRNEHNKRMRKSSLFTDLLKVVSLDN